MIVPVLALRLRFSFESAAREIAFFYPGMSPKASSPSPRLKGM